MAKQINKNKSIGQWLHSTRLHVTLYSMLLVATPFIMLQNFLQEAIGSLSRLSFTAFDREIAYVPAAGAALVIIAIAVFYRHITRRVIYAAIAVILLDALAQQIADYYFDHKFYDLQQNWHYIAYGIFAFMMYRDLHPKGTPPNQILLRTYLFALSYSAFDEAFQMHLSNRIFDIGDIAKDVWGVFMGMVVLFICGTYSDVLRSGFKKLRHRKLMDYYHNPASLFVLLFALSFILLYVSSILTDFPYWKQIIIITVTGFMIFFVVFHFSQFRWGRNTFLVILLLAIAVQSFFYIRYRHENIIYNDFGITIYKGIPIPYFDVAFFPDGGFRLVDKKHEFNMRDRQFFLNQKTDILLIGSGKNGKGGNGFSKKESNQFIYNRLIGNGTQVIILDTSNAVKIFNRLKQEKKNVLFILHNTC